MALQGTIEEFALEDVLQLLAASRKTGVLVVRGDRGDARLEVVRGRLVDGEVRGRPAEDPDELVFEFLRFVDGSFLFEAAEPPAGGEDDGGVALGEVIGRAEVLVGEWRELTAAIPSFAHAVRPAVTAPTDEVVLARSEWEVLAVLGAGRSVEQLVEHFGDELRVCRSVATLAEAGLLEFSEPATMQAEVAFEAESHPTRLFEAPGHRSSAPAVSFGTERPVEPIEAAVVEGITFPDHFPIDDMVAEGSPPVADSRPSVHSTEWHPDDAWDQYDVVPRPPAPSVDTASGLFDDPARMPVPEAPITAMFGSAPPEAPAEQVDELLRQVRGLSPEAAAAIADAIGTVPGEHRDPDDPSLRFTEST